METTVKLLDYIILNHFNTVNIDDIFHVVLGICYLFVSLY